MGKLNTGDDLFKEAEKRGVSTSQIGDNYGELQRRVIEAKRFQRENKFWVVALASAIASIVSAAAAWYAIFIRPCP